jgi:hypothetical protein
MVSFQAMDPEVVLSVKLGKAFEKNMSASTSFFDPLSSFVLIGVWLDNFEKSRLLTSTTLRFRVFIAGSWSELGGLELELELESESELESPCDPESSGDSEPSMLARSLVRVAFLFFFAFSFPFFAAFLLASCCSLSSFFAAFLSAFALVFLMALGLGGLVKGGVGKAVSIRSGRNSRAA